MRRLSIRNLFIFLAVVILLFFVFQCSQDNSTEEGSFDIYLISDSELNILEFSSADIESIDLPDNLVTSICDIDTYKIFQSESSLSLSHSIIFKSDMKEKFGNDNCYFVLVVNGDRMYKGEYWANFMNTYLQNVLIYPRRDNEFHILTVDDAEQINDSRIINTLINSGVNVVYQNIE
ncbi:MAG: hypothetical protein U9R41_02980 [Candidatus Marinimicrobia bacterium]|nr:hypothetical protein [Candidatus Neomarinimicrobiota bacterium]